MANPKDSSDSESEEESTADIIESSESDSDSEETSSSSDDDDDTGESAESSNKEDFKSKVTPAGDADQQCPEPDLLAVKKKSSEESGCGVTGRRRRRQRPLTICLTHCRYELVSRMSKKFGLMEVKEDQPWNIYWTDFSVSLERATELRRFQIVNHFPGMSEICRKDLLARNLNRLKRSFPDEYNIYPRTWCLPSDYNDLQIFSQSRRGKTYICKPEMGCQGKGIFLVRKIQHLKEREAPYGRIICQLYIQKPFLIDDLKFDLRIYVLITSCDPLRVYVYEEGMVRFATAKYRQPSTNNTDNSYMHLTNYAVNKFSDNFVADEESGTKRKLTTIYKWMEERGIDVDEVKRQIDDVMLKTILSAQPIIKHHYRTCFPYHDLCSACFEILGFDILLDHRLKPFVIEVNHSPSFHTDTAVDREIKESVLNDTFAMLNIKQLERVKVEREDRKRVQERLSVKLAEARAIMEGKTKSNAKAQKQPKEEIPEPRDPPPLKRDYNQEQFKWEMDHLGRFRLIYPLPDSIKYDKFLIENQVSLYQETAASQARANLTRAQLEESEMKRQIEESKRVGGNKRKEKSDKVEPESPSHTRTASKSRKKVVVGTEPTKGFKKCFIVTEEEAQRVRSLNQRGLHVRSLGIEFHAYNLLTMVGSLKNSDHDEFRRKHGFTVPPNRPSTVALCPDDLNLNCNPSPKRTTTNNPTRKPSSRPKSKRRDLSKPIQMEIKSTVDVNVNASTSPSTNVSTNATVSAKSNNTKLQGDYLRAKWAAHNKFRESQSQLLDKRPMSSYNLTFEVPSPGIRRPNNLLALRFQANSKPSSPNGFRATAEKPQEIRPINRNLYSNLYTTTLTKSVNFTREVPSVNVIGSNYNEPDLLPTGPAAVSAIGKDLSGGFNATTFLKRSNEFQRLYNIYHDRKLVDNLASKNVKR